MAIPDRVLGEMAQSYLQGGYRLGDQPLPRNCVVAVYGRYSVELAERLANVVDQVEPQLLAISGNVGNDSGPLTLYGIPEAHYLLSAADVLTHGLVMRRTPLAVDLTATNGAENAARLVELIRQLEYGVSVPCRVVVLAHQVQMRRLGLTFDAAAKRQELLTDQIVWVPSLFEPDLSDPVQLWEVLREYALLDELSGQGLFPRPEGLRQDLVTEARRVRDELAAQIPAHERTTAWAS